MSSALPLLALLRDGEHDAHRQRLFDLVIAEVARLETRLAQAEASSPKGPEG